MVFWKNKLFYGWVLVMGFFVTNTIIMGTNTSFGVFFKSLESDFALTRATTSAVLSVRMLLGALTSFLGGWALDKYGPRIIVLLMGLSATLSLILTSQTTAAWQLFITFSLLLSLGTGASYVVVMSTISRWFNRRRGMAIGVTGAGGGLGQVVMAPFAAFLISSYDWRVAYIVMGLLAGAVIVPVSRILKRDPKEIGALPDGDSPAATSFPQTTKEPRTESLQPSGLSIMQTLRTRSFWLIAIMQIFTAFSVFLIMTHVVPYATDLGFSPIEAATILSLIGASMMMGRILVGTASDKIGRKKAAIISASVQVGGLLLLLQAKELWMLYLFAFIHGFTQGGLGTALTAFFGDIFGLRNLGKLIGVINISWTVGAALGPVVGGLIFDTFNSYHLAFLIIVVVMAVRPLFLALIKRETEEIT